jgi:small subunit ribosomal protein S9
MEKNVAIGRRKASVARVYIKKGKGQILINGKDYKDFFGVIYMQQKVEKPLKVAELEGAFDLHINVNGGGIKGQAEAIALGISRAILLVDPEKRPALKAERLLTRDARVVERKKTGLRKARKKEQYSKR